MEISVKTKCPHCEREIIIEAKSKQEPDRQSSDYINSLFEKKISQQEDLYKKPSDALQLNEFIRSVESGSKSTAKDYLYDYFFMLKEQIRDTNNKKELVKIRNKLKNTHVKVSEILKKELKENKEELLKEIENKIKKIKK